MARRTIKKTQQPVGRKKGHKLNMDSPPSTNGHHKPKGHKPENPVRILRPVVYLPKELTAIEQAIEKTLAKQGVARYYMNLVRVHLGDKDFRLEGTDGKMLVILRGDNPLPSKVAGIEANLLDCPEPVDSVIVPAEEFLHRLKAMRGDYVGCRLSSRGLHMADSNTVSLVASSTESRFPPVEEIIPTSPPLFSIRFSADVLARLLRVVLTLTEPDDRAIQLLFWNSNSPVGFVKVTKGGLLMDALAMPLTPP